ncbi:MAG: ferrous iron transport protein B [Oscillospiraceae bacterium]|nr:ferrous iron transport protein B [Oscillospiraceae bacterium]
MGLTNKSVSKNALDEGLKIKKENPSERVIAVAGNPNVGKSTLFNALTGMNQHTGNWPGKTVASAQGRLSTKNHSYVLVDIPGTYSLMAHSAEEEVARNFICFGESDAIIVVCDATCLMRNMNLVLQTMEISKNVIVCVNLLDEAKRKNIKVDLKELQNRLGVPVVGVVAQKKKTLKALTDTLDRLCDGEIQSAPCSVRYTDEIEAAIAALAPILDKKTLGRVDSRWLALRLLDRDSSLSLELKNYLGFDILSDGEIIAALGREWQRLGTRKRQSVKDEIVCALVRKGEEIVSGAVKTEGKYNNIDRKVDRILTSRWAGYPAMIALLLLIFWLTITAANYPSQLLSQVLFWLQDRLSDLFVYLGAPDWLHGALVLGVYRVLAWVVSVMLPPMAIFFPLFTLLEDLGYLPRVAFNLDKPFHRCNACGKQALTMCMGFGCNAAGVVGCRIIDSPRERLLAILTNNFVPCNGRFPTLISILTMFFVGTASGLFSSMGSAALLCVVILLGIGMTFLMTLLLSKTLLRGVPSSFTLELPPYRKPQIGKTILRSIFDRTLFVLGRAAAVAAPAGLFIWLVANMKVDGASLLSYASEFLDPFAGLMGLDGVILIAFILGFPANEIVVPIIIMAYLSQGTLTDMASLFEMKTLFVDNGWTALTAINVMLFSLFHFPCSTTLITIKKETGSLKWTLVSALLPTAVGIICCMLTTAVARLLI